MCKTFSMPKTYSVCKQNVELVAEQEGAISKEFVGSLMDYLTPQESQTSLNGLRAYILPSKPNEIRKEYQ